MGEALSKKISGDCKLEDGSQASEVPSPTTSGEKEEAMEDDSRDLLLSAHVVEGIRS